MIGQFGREFVASASQERTSKEASLKINCGGISINRTRNHEAMDLLRDEYERQQFSEES